MNIQDFIRLFLFKFPLPFQQIKDYLSVDEKHIHIERTFGIATGAV